MLFYAILLKNKEGRGEDEDKKMEKRERKKKHRFTCLLVCFYYHITYQATEVHESEVTCLACVKVRRKQPHLPSKHIVCYLFVTLHLKIEEPQSRCTAIATIREEEAIPVITSMFLSSEHMWASLLHDTQQKMTVASFSLAWLCACRQLSH